MAKDLPIGPDAYITRLAPKEVLFNFQGKRVINPKRGAKRTVPYAPPNWMERKKFASGYDAEEEKDEDDRGYMLDWDKYVSVKDTLLSEFGLESYVGCLTAEMPSRPVPHVFREQETAALTALYERRIPAVFQRILRLLRAPIQPLNRDSRLGWPWFNRPDSKKLWLEPDFRRLEHEGAASFLQGSYIIMNVRLQPEPKDKKREMLFVSADGETYSRTVDADARKVNIKTIGLDGTAARTRLVFNLPTPNLYKQVLDTAIHSVLLSFPVFSHNMYAVSWKRPVRGTPFALDVKHFERHTASLARARGRLLGGLYADISEQFAAAPFLCPSDDWKKAFLMWPNRAAGYSDQFASGDSAVAPVQKEVFLCLYQEFAETVLGVSPSSSMDWVLQGGDDRLSIWNYGDDNFLSGDAAVIEECFSFLSGYLHVEKEDPMKFLGFLYTTGGFKLSKDSYILKTWLNEREPYSSFRQFPFFGWVEKRKVYSQYGLPEIQQTVFPREDALLAEAGLPWRDVLAHSQLEAIVLSTRAGAYRDPSWLLGKDYLMTPEQKVATGVFEGLYPSETAPMIKRLLGDRWHKDLT